MPAALPVAPAISREEMHHFFVTHLARYDRARRTPQRVPILRLIFAYIVEHIDLFVSYHSHHQLPHVIIRKCIEFSTHEYLLRHHPQVVALCHRLHDLLVARCPPQALVG